MWSIHRTPGTEKQSPKTLSSNFQEELSAKSARKKGARIPPKMAYQLAKAIRDEDRANRQRGASAEPLPWQKSHKKVDEAYDARLGEAIDYLLKADAAKMTPEKTGYVRDYMWKYTDLDDFGLTIETLRTKKASQIRTPIDIGLKAFIAKLLFPPADILLTSIAAAIFIERTLNFALVAAIKTIPSLQKKYEKLKKAHEESNEMNLDSTAISKNPSKGIWVHAINVALWAGSLAVCLINGVENLTWSSIGFGTLAYSIALNALAIPLLVKVSPFKKTVIARVQNEFNDAYKHAKKSYDADLKRKESQVIVSESQ